MTDLCVQKTGEDQFHLIILTDNGRHKREKDR